MSTETKKIIVDLEIKHEDIQAAKDAMSSSKKEVEAYQKELNALKDQQKELNALYRVGAKDADTYAKEQTDIKTQMTEVNKKMRESNKVYTSNKTVIDAAKGSNEQLRARLSLLTKQYNGLSKEQRQNSKQGQQMGATIKTITDKLKANEKAVGDNRRNVGNYTDAVKGLTGNLNIMGVNVGGVISQLQSQKAALQAMAGAQKASTAATMGGVGAMQLFKAAMISTGIGALIVALGSMVAFLTSTKRGVELLDRAMAGIKATFAVLTDRASALGEGLINAFKNPKQTLKELGEFIKSQIINRFTAIPAILQAVGKGFQALANRDLKGMKDAAADAAQAVIQLNTGLDPDQQKKIADGIKGVAKEIGDEAKAAVALEGQLQKLKDAERALTVEVSQRKAEVAKLQLIAEDEANSYKERTDAIQKANEIQAGQMEKELDLQRQRVAIFEQQLALGENLEEDEDALAEQRARLGEIEARNLKKLRSLKAKEISISRQEAAEINKAANATRKLTEDQIKAEEQAAEKRAKIREDFRREQLSELERAKEDALEKAQVLRDAGTEEIEVQAFLSDQLIEIDRAEKDARLQETLKTFEAEAEAARVKVRAEIENAEVRKAALMQIDQELLEAKQQTLDLEANQYEASIEGFAMLDVERQDQILEQKALVDAELIELDRQKTEMLIENEERLAEKRRQEAETYKQSATGTLGVVGDVIGGLQGMLQDNIKQIEEQAKAAGKSDEQISELTKKKRKKAHQLAVAAAIVQTLQAAISAYSSGAAVPIVGVALGPIAAAAAAAFGFAQVAQMKQTKFAKGGVLSGASHAEGGIQMYGRGGEHYGEAEGGEIVLTKGVYSDPQLRREANDLNIRGGGESFMSSGYRQYMASGGVLGRTPSAQQQQGVNLSQMTEAFAEALRSAPSPVVRVTDINRKNAQAVKVISKSELA